MTKGETTYEEQIRVSDQNTGLYEYEDHADIGYAGEEARVRMVWDAQRLPKKGRRMSASTRIENLKLKTKQAEYKRWRASRINYFSMSGRMQDLHEFLRTHS